MAFIYVITNDINGKQYVGKTNNSIEQRFKEHISDSKKRRCENRPLYAAMNKYGVEHFSIEMLEECSSEDSSERETYWIQQLNTYGNTGYNATLGGDSKHYYDYNELSQAYLELGTVKAVCDKYHCDRHTVQVACKENDVKILSGQDYNKINRSKKVKMIDKNTGNVLKVFPSCRAASREIAGNNSGYIHISKVCKGKEKTAYGYKWEFVE